MNNSSSNHYREKADTHRSWAIIWALLAAVLIAHAVALFSAWSFILGAFAVGSLLLSKAQFRRFNEADSKWLLHICRTEDL